LFADSVFEPVRNCGKFQLLLQALHLDRFEDAETIPNTDLT
jgi:hypothetical protein